MEDRQDREICLARKTAGRGNLSVRPVAAKKPEAHRTQGACTVPVSGFTPTTRPRARTCPREDACTRPPPAETAFLHGRKRRRRASCLSNEAMRMPSHESGEEDRHRRIRIEWHGQRRFREICVAHGTGTSASPAAPNSSTQRSVVCRRRAASRPAVGQPAETIARHARNAGRRHRACTPIQGKRHPRRYGPCTDRPCSLSTTRPLCCAGPASPVRAAPENCTAWSSAARRDTHSGRAATGDEDCDRWRQAVDVLFVAHSIARAMRSVQQEELRLRDAMAHYLPQQDRAQAHEDR
jgi:hypothetical protein